MWYRIVQKDECSDFKIGELVEIVEYLDWEINEIQQIIVKNKSGLYQTNDITSVFR